MFDYLFGYSLWLIIGVMAAFAAIKMAIGKRKKPAEMPEMP